jgi:hypothetical protein
MPFRFDPLYRGAALVFGVTSANSHTTVTDESLAVGYGPWQVRTPLSNIASAEVTGPYHRLKTLGPARLSFADRGLTFASNSDEGVFIVFHRPITGADPWGRVLSPNLTVTVAGCQRLVAALLPPT